MKQDYEKGDFKHFMAKEIEEQPTTLKIVLKNMLIILIMILIFITFLGIKRNFFYNLIGCGTAYHSCLMAKYWFEELTS